jgi:hypothetical protein
MPPKSLKRQAHRSFCIFCGGGGVFGNKMSGEHLWSDWMDDLLPHSNEYLEFKTTFSGGNRTPSRITERTRPGASNKKKLKVVCTNCNTQWMSRIETIAKPYLTSLITGEPIFLDRAAKNIVARWIVLKMFISDHNSVRDHPADPIFDQPARDDFRLSSQVPDGIRIWLGSHQGDKWRAAFLRSSTGVGFAQTYPPPQRPDGRYPNTMAITWGIGRLLIYSIAALDPQVYALFAFDHPGTFRDLWPLNDVEYFFPRRSSLDDRQIDDLSTAFNDFIRRTVVTWVPA